MFCMNLLEVAMSKKFRYRLTYKNAQDVVCNKIIDVKSKFKLIRLAKKYIKQYSVVILYKEEIKD